ncbi:MAG: preprotein translocase subunit SecF, partial [Gammaproteobacteria bacterium]
MLKKHISKHQINFMGLRKPAMILSAIMILVSIFCLATLKLNVGIDFTGGSIIEVGYQQPVELEPIRDVLSGNGYEDAVVQHFGSASEVLIRLVPKTGQNEAETSSEV